MRRASESAVIPGALSDPFSLTATARTHDRNDLLDPVFKAGLFLLAILPGVVAASLHRPLGHGALYSLCLVSTVTDLRFGKVFNGCTLPFLALGLGLAAASPPSGPGFGSALLGSVVGFALLLVLYMFSSLGAGDVKLVAAIGAFTGFPVVLDVVATSFLIAGVYSAGLIAARLGWRASAWWVGQLAVRLVAPRLTSAPLGVSREVLAIRLPLAPFIATGTFLVTSGVGVLQ